MCIFRSLISVIVPVYNAEEFLAHCVESILGQTHENLELILIDDGSTDDSPALCDKFAVQDTRVKVIHQANGGIGAAQNAGLDLAQGEYIAFADNDDILDARNLEILLAALLQTGSDMSKARWRQFGVSSIDAIKREAKRGHSNAYNLTTFDNPLAAYQNVFCKSLRLAGDKFGHKTEARYFNEANWCRLYKCELWDDVRFPLGMYAQDVMVAGELYLKMHRVVDVDAVLYYWLQSAGSVTHNERSFGFYHDNFSAGAANFSLALARGVTPARSYYTLAGSFAEELTARDANKPKNVQQHNEDAETLKTLLSSLSPAQILKCATLQKIRLAEKHIYDAKIKNMK